MTPGGSQSVKGEEKNKGKEVRRARSNRPVLFLFLKLCLTNEPELGAEGAPDQVRWVSVEEGSESRIRSWLNERKKKAKAHLSPQSTWEALRSRTTPPGEEKAVAPDTGSHAEEGNRFCPLPAKPDPASVAEKKKKRVGGVIPGSSASLHNSTK